jgi:predicted regulator of Ras-like GTPase activity (Roadblock/LC7/MglB family)
VIKVTGVLPTEPFQKFGIFGIKLIMGMTGNLTGLAAADLIQLNCVDQKVARLQIKYAEKMAEIYFFGGQIVHAVCGDQRGEEIVYQVLGWNEGDFSLENEVNSPETTIQRSWPSLLLEGARRLDEKELAETPVNFEKETESKEKKMAQKFEEILSELAGEVTGFRGSFLVGIDGINLASKYIGELDPELVSAQMAMLLKLVSSSTDKLGAGNLEDNLTTTEKAYILMRFLPGKQYFLGISAERKSGNLGNMRLMSKMYTDKLAKAMPH